MRIIERREDGRPQFVRKSAEFHPFRQVLCEVIRGLFDTATTADDGDSSRVRTRPTPQGEDLAVRHPPRPDDRDVHVDVPLPVAAGRHFPDRGVRVASHPLVAPLVEPAPAVDEVAAVGVEVARVLDGQGQQAQAAPPAAAGRVRPGARQPFRQSSSERVRAPTTTRGAHPPLPAASGDDEGRARRVPAPHREHGGAAPCDARPEGRAQGARARRRVLVLCRGRGLLRPQGPLFLLVGQQG